jgi:hypothetical protein
MDRKIDAIQPAGRFFIECDDLNRVAASRERFAQRGHRPRDTACARIERLHHLQNFQSAKIKVAA